MKPLLSRAGDITGFSNTEKERLKIYFPLEFALSTIGVLPPPSSQELKMGCRCSSSKIHI